MYKKNVIKAVLIIVTLALVFFGLQKIFPETNERLPIDHSMTIAGKTFQVQIANTSKTQKLGLSYFKSLPENQGMLFVFDHPAQYAFWMKDMHFAIDVLWMKQVSENTYRIIGLQKNVTPESYPASFSVPEPVDAFLELNAGTLDQFPKDFSEQLVVVSKNSI